jgi:hypothetical protein
MENVNMSGISDAGVPGARNRSTNKVKRKQVHRVQT